jgi:hypothetical protein
VTVFTVLPGNSAYGADLTPWTIEEANLTLSLPSDLSVITRDGVQSNPELVEEMGASDESLQEILLDAHAYVDAVAPNASYEYMVIVVDPEEGEKRVWNAVDMPKYLKKSLPNEVVEEVKSEGYIAKSEGVRSIGGADWYVFTGSKENGGDDYTQYYTIVNGRMTSITLHSYQGPVTDELNDQLQQVVESTSFLKVSEDPNPKLGKGGINWFELGSRVGTFTVVGGIIGLIIFKSNKKRKARQTVNPSPTLEPQ